MNGQVGEQSCVRTDWQTGRQMDGWKSRQTDKWRGESASGWKGLYACTLLADAKICVVEKTILHVNWTHYVTFCVDRILWLFSLCPACVAVLYTSTRYSMYYCKGHRHLSDTFVQSESVELLWLLCCQAFRSYREVFEEQKLVLEQRFRSLLEDAIQDAIFLSTTNSELQQETERLREGL